MQTISAAKRTQSSLQRDVIRNAIAEVRIDLVTRGQHDRAMLVEIAARAIPDEALNAIYKAVKADV